MSDRGIPRVLGTRVDVMEHAVNRYIERIGPANLGPRRARGRLLEAVRDATVESPPWSVRGGRVPDLWLRSGDMWLPCVLLKGQGRRYGVTTVLTRDRQRK